MTKEYLKWLTINSKKFEHCIHSIADWGRCTLDGYPILDCANCNTFKEREFVKEINEQNCLNM
jgi:hypothetical protein